MFDGILPEPDSVAELDDAALITAMTGWSAVESAAAARRLAMMAEFTTRRMGGAEHSAWMCDDWDAASAEVGAALNVSPGRASVQMTLAITLRDRLPKVAALFADGALTARTIAMIARRTDLVQDPDALAALDIALAERAVAWGPISDRKLEKAIDVWVIAADPDAVRRTSGTARDREFSVGDPYDHDGITTVWGRLLATDAKLLDTRLTAMARSVCDDDPRTLAQRRADALGALAAGSDHLTCACGAPACPAAADDGRASSVVIHVLAPAESLDAPTDPGCHGEDRPDVAAELRAPSSGSAPAEPPSAPPRPSAAVIVGGAILPATLLAELLNAGAQVRLVQHPSAEPELRYRPSTALDEWVRMRDLTCRAPGCDQPAVYADIDHTVPWPAGATHPSNNKCYCRKHHLINTFWPGWTDRQHPDGTVVWTTPTGHTYTTRPLSNLLFPSWVTTTAPLPEPPAQSPPNSARGLMMPKRKRTRAKEREYRINAERAINAANNIPPPF